MTGKDARDGWPDKLLQWSVACRVPFTRRSGAGHQGPVGSVLLVPSTRP